MYTPTASGGHARYTWELMSALSRVPDCEVELVSSETLEPQFRAAPYPVHAILPSLTHRREFRTKLTWAASRLMHYPRCERLFLEWLRGRPDIGIVHFQEQTFWLAEALYRSVRALGKRVFYTVHNVRPHAYPPLIPRHMVDDWDRQSWRQCDGLFVLSEQLRDDLSKFLGRGHPPIHVAPHGTWSPTGARPAGSIRERLRAKRLLFFGNIRRNKGLDVLLRAAESLPDYSLTIAGEPRELRYFEAEVVPAVERLRSAGRDVRLMNQFIPDDHLADLFAQHSAFVLPYTTDFTAQSGVVFMALTHDIPVIASAVGGLRDLLGQFRIGRTFEANRHDQLAAAIRDLHEGGRADDLAEEIRRAKARYSWESAAEETAKAYRAAAGNAERAA
jgi:glycosyltransferase involved in cell wall biosynthesis